LIMIKRDFNEKDPHVTLSHIGFSVQKNK
jgi:hypothetical protein